MLLFHNSNIECLKLRLAHAFYTFISKWFNEEMFIYHIWIVEHTAVVSSAFRLLPSISMANERERKGESNEMNAARRNAERVEKAESITNTQIRAPSLDGWMLGGCFTKKCMNILYTAVYVYMDN